MQQDRFPRLPIPEQLRGEEMGSFAHTTIAVRLPDIARRILDENDFPADIEARLEGLIENLPYGVIRSLHDASAPDYEDWEEYVRPYKGLTWLQVPWFFAEHYFYRRVLESIGYFLPGWGRLYDPYAYQKRQGLETKRDDIRNLSLVMDEITRNGKWQNSEFRRLVISDLWGNQSDLSLWPAEAGEKPDSRLSHKPDHRNEEKAQSHILIDHTEQVSDYLERLREKTLRVDFLIDNAGFELAADLCLAAYLLASSVAGEIRFHLKAHPTFVSDAMIKDVQHTIEFLLLEPTMEAQALGARLKKDLEWGRLLLKDDFFWTSPLSMWEMPGTLKDELGKSDLVINKGDANFRRLVGDRHWAFSTPFEDILNYFPAPLLVLRALKSEVMAGLQLHQVEDLNKEDANWLTDGRWGMILFSNLAAS